MTDTKKTKNYLLITVLVFLAIMLILFLLVKKNSVNNDQDNYIPLENVSGNEYTMISNSIDKNNIVSIREGISADDISLMYANVDVELENPLLKMGKVFMDNLDAKNTTPLTTKFDGGLAKEDLQAEINKLDSDFARNFTIMLNLYDYETGEAMTEKSTVYVNGVNLGTAENGVFEGDFSWPLGIEKFNIIVRNMNYGDGILSLNSLNTNGELIIGNIYMKKSKVEEINLESDADFDFEDFTLEVPECTVVEANGKCFNGTATVRTNYVYGDEINNNQLSLDMLALTPDGELSYLKSGGMAFVDIIDENGNILNVKKGDRVTVTYNVTQEEIDNMDSNRFGGGNNNGYWWYDKDSGIWRFNETIETFLDRENNTWTAIVDILY